MPHTREQTQESIQALVEVLRLLGLDADVEEIEAQDGLSLELKTAEPGRIIGRKGQHLDSLEFILNRVLRRKGEYFPRVSITVNGYRREPRPHRGRGVAVDAERLNQLALDTAKEVRRWGEPRTLGAMNSRERRAIHVALRDEPGVETASGPDEGRGMKRVTVRPSPGE